MLLQTKEAEKFHIAEDSIESDNLKSAFLKLAGDDEEIDAFELMNIFNTSLKRGLLHDLYPTTFDFSLLLIYYLNAIAAKSNQY